MSTSVHVHDNLAIPQNNLLDGREYKQWLGFLYAEDFRPGDVITDGIGTYEVARVGGWSAGCVPAGYVLHIQIAHTLAGPIVGGLIRGRDELLHVLARRREVTS